MNVTNTGRRESSESSVESTQDSDGVGSLDEESHSSGNPPRGSSPSGHGGGHFQRGLPVVPSEDGDHLRDRHSAGVSGPGVVGKLEEDLTVAFTSGDPETVWKASRSLLAYAEQVTKEAATLRFQVNFGTDRCQNCTGLKAGPGVVATCFQMKQCFYSNFRGDTISPKQGRVLDYLDAIQKKSPK